MLSCLGGYSVCIFTYGQTGTGKTYSMEVGKGAVGELWSQGLGCELAEAPHAIPRARLRTPASLLGHCSPCSRRWAQAGSTA